MKKSKFLEGPVFDGPHQEGVAGGSKIKIGDGVYLTAGHMVFEYNHAHDSDPQSISLNDIVTGNSLSGQVDVLSDPRGYRNEYLAVVQAEYSGSGNPRPNDVLEGTPALYQRDSVLIKGAGSADSGDVGLVRFLDPNEMVGVSQYLPAATENLDGYISGEKSGAVSEVDDGTYSQLSGVLYFSEQDVHGDSGGGIILSYDDRDYVIGTISGQTASETVATWFTDSDWQAIHSILQQGQSGDVTNNEPHDLIVGTSEGDAFAGTFRADILLGGEGNDDISDGDQASNLAWADDMLFGGAGDDTFHTGRGNDLIHGGDYREYDGAARVALDADGVDTAEYETSAMQELTKKGLEVLLVPSDDPEVPAWTYGNDVDRDHAIYVIDQNTDTFSSDGQDTLISVEKLKLTDTNDTVSVKSLDSNLLAGSNGQGGISEIDLGGNPSGKGDGDVVTFDGLAEDVTVDARNTDAGSGSAKISATADATRSFSVTGAEKYFGSDGHMTVYSIGNGEYHAGAGGATFYMQSGDIAVGHDGVEDDFYVTTVPPAGMTDEDAVAWLDQNQVYIGDFGQEDKLFVNGVLFDGNKRTSEFAPERIQDYNADLPPTTSLSVNGGSSYGTIYPHADFIVDGDHIVNGEPVEWGHYAYPSNGQIRDVTYSVGDGSGAGTIDFYSGTYESDGDYVSPLPLSAGDEALSIVITGFENGNGGITFSHDQFSQPSSTWLGITGPANWFGDVPPDGTGPVIDLGSPDYDNGFKLTDSNDVDWQAYARGEYTGPADAPVDPAFLADPRLGSSGEYWGTNISFVGDVNGDGYDDVLVGNPDGGDSTYWSTRGEAFLVFGNADGSFPQDLTNLNSNQAIRISSASDLIEVGATAVGVGDYNGDGYDDILVSASTEGTYNYDTYRYEGFDRTSYLIYGHGDSWGDIDLDSWSSADGVEFTGIEQGPGGSQTVSAIGDVNGDGFDDFAMQRWDYDPGDGSHPGGVSVLFGESDRPASVDLTSLSSADGFFIAGSQAGSATGWSISAAGDVNGDGVDDFVIGAPEADDGEGAAYVMFGRTSGFGSLDLGDLAASDGFSITGSTLTEVGSMVSAVGDFNGDGYDDISVGTSDRLFVVFGGASLGHIDLDNLGAAGFEIEPSDGFSWSSTSYITSPLAGDVNGDGFSDLILGSGTVLYGRSDVPSVIDLYFTRSSEGEVFDTTNELSTYAIFKGGGDFNGDGSPDVLVQDTPPTSSATKSISVILSEPPDTTVRPTDGFATLSAGEDQPFVFNIDGGWFSGDTSAVEYSLSTYDGEPAPDWITLADGQIRGTPPANFNGDFPIQVVATTPTGVATKPLVLDVAPVNDAPTVDGVLNDVQVNAGESFAFDTSDISFSDVDGDPLTVTVSLANGSDLPGWISFDGTTFSGVAPAGLAEDFAIQVHASDGSAEVSSPFSLDVVSPYTEIAGTDSADDLYGTDGADDMTGLGSDDRFYGSAGADHIDGGDGQDWVSFASSASAVSLSLATGGTAGDAAGDTYIAVENVLGSNYDDYIEGDAADNLLNGSNGDDVLIGGAGNDDLRGSAGSDILHGGDGNDKLFTDYNDGAGDQIFGDGGDDYLQLGDLDVGDGGTGDDQIIIKGDNVVALGGDGNDSFGSVSASGLQLDGGAGNDQLSLMSSSSINVRFTSLSGIEWIIGNANNPGMATITIDATSLDLSGAQFTSYLDIAAGLNSDTTIVGPASATMPAYALLRIFGAGGNDNLTGSVEVGDEIFGNAGNDQLFGLGGDDSLTGGAGDDQLDGGSGTDTAYFSGELATYSIATAGGVLMVQDNDAVADGNDGTDTISSVETLSFKNGETISVASPIILDLGGDGIETTSAAQSNAGFDWNGDGLADDTSWIGTGEGLLYLDRNGDGTASGADELSFVDDVPGAASDLAGLRAFDTNGDGLLSSDDERFADFGVWRDANGDGVVDPDETSSLATNGIESIDLAGTPANATYQFGEVATVNSGTYTLTDGATHKFADAALTYFSAGSNSSEVETSSSELDPTVGNYRGPVGLPRKLQMFGRDEPVSSWSAPALASARAFGGTSAFKEDLPLKRVSLDQRDEPNGATGTTARELDKSIEEMLADGFADLAAGETADYARVNLQHILGAMRWGGSPSAEIAMDHSGQFTSGFEPGANTGDLSLLVQNLAAFGAGGALHGQEIGRERVHEPLDFFA